MKQLNSVRKNVIQNSNLNVMKQMIDKERRQWTEEEKALQTQISTLQGRLEANADELQQREETDKLVQGHVQELISQN